jgi:hypothetical protein
LPPAGVLVIMVVVMGPGVVVGAWLRAALNRACGDCADRLGCRGAGLLVVVLELLWFARVCVRCYSHQPTLLL